MKVLTPHTVVTKLKEHFENRLQAQNPDGPRYSGGCALSILAEGEFLAALARHDSLPIDEIAAQDEQVHSWVGETLPLLYDLQCAHDALLRFSRDEAYDGILEHLASAVGVPLEKLQFSDCIDQLAFQHGVASRRERSQETV